MYDMSANVYASVEKISEYGYLAFDNKYRYINANKFIKELFPEISTWVVDETVPASDSYLYNEIVCYLMDDSVKKDEGKTINVNASYYHVDIRPISYGKRAEVGYLVELVDRTLEQNYYRSLEEHNAKMEQLVAEKTEEIRIQQKKIKELFIQTVSALSDAVDAKDRYTSGHSKRVAEYACMLAKRMGKSEEELEEIYHAGLLHDMGKIRVPAEIINKPGKLTAEEYDVIKIHPVTGYHILHEISEGKQIAIGAKYHHERYDGTGYPNGLIGDKIPEIARILAVADAYDAMASNRSYRNALPQDVVKKEIERGKGTQFDPYIAELMLQMIREDSDYLMKQEDMVRRKILTVDDEEMNNEIIKQIMKDEPMYKVVSVNSGKEAIEILEQQTFDLVLLDVMMPGMDGIETLKEIRKRSQVPVVFMTGDRMMDATSVYTQLGCDDYITKPFLPILVKEVVHNMVRR